MNARHSALLLVAASAVAACIGCSNALPAGASAVAQSPTVAFAAAESDLSPVCTLEGMPRVLATHVMPMAGVSAESDGRAVWLRFATKGDPRAALAIDVATLDVMDEGGAAPADPVAPAAARRVPGGAVAVALRNGRSLVAWTDGSAYEGMRVRGITLASDGAATGTPIDLGYEGSAIGRPALAMTPSGRGVLAFEESNGAGFHLVAARVVCR